MSHTHYFSNEPRNHGGHGKLIELNQLLLEISATYDKAFILLSGININATCHGCRGCHTTRQPSHAIPHPWQPGQAGTSCLGSVELTRAIAALEVSQAAYDHAMTIIGEFEEYAAGK